MNQRTDSFSRGSSVGLRKQSFLSDDGESDTDLTLCTSPKRPLPLQNLRRADSSGFTVVRPESLRGNLSPHAQKRWAARLKAFICLLLASIIVITLITWEIRHLRSEMRRVAAFDQLHSLNRQGGGLHDAEAPGELALEEKLQKKKLLRSKRLKNHQPASSSSMSSADLKQLAVANLAGSFGSEGGRGGGGGGGGLLRESASSRTKGGRKVGGSGGLLSFGGGGPSWGLEAEEDQGSGGGSSSASSSSSSSALTNRLNRAKAAFKDLEQTKKKSSAAAAAAIVQTEDKGGSGSGGGSGGGNRKRAAMTAAIQEQKELTEESVSAKLSAREEKKWQAEHEKAMVLEAKEKKEAQHAQETQRLSSFSSSSHHHVNHAKLNLQPNRLNLRNKSQKGEVAVKNNDNDGHTQDTQQQQQKRKKKRVKLKEEEAVEEQRRRRRRQKRRRLTTEEVGRKGALGEMLKRSTEEKNFKGSRVFSSSSTIITSTRSGTGTSSTNNSSRRVDIPAAQGTSTTTTPKTAAAAPSQTLQRKALGYFGAAAQTGSAGTQLEEEANGGVLGKGATRGTTQQLRAGLAAKAKSGQLKSGQGGDL